MYTHTVILQGGHACEQKQLTYVLLVNMKPAAYVLRNVIKLYTQEEKQFQETSYKLVTSQVHMVNTENKSHNDINTVHVCTVGPRLSEQLCATSMLKLFR